MKSTSLMLFRALISCLLVCLFCSSSHLAAALTQYSVSGLPAFATAGQPVDITVRGVGEDGRIISLATAPQELRASELEDPPTVLLTEWSLLPGIELMNVSVRTQSLAGWQIEMFTVADLKVWNRTPTLTFPFPSGAECKPGKLITVGPILPGSSGKPDFIVSIDPVFVSNLGMIALVDDTGATRDVFVPNYYGFVGGYLPEWITPHDWVDVFPGRVVTEAARFGGVDRNNIRDWSRDVLSFGTPNADLRLPFAGVTVERRMDLLSSELRDGTWYARVRFMEPGKALRLQASSLTGIEGKSEAVEVISAPALNWTLPATILEGGRITSTLRLPATAAHGETVRLTCPLHGDRLRFPAELVVPPGPEGVSFEIEALENTRLEGTLNLRLTAQSGDGGEAKGTLTLLDNEEFSGLVVVGAGVQDGRFVLNEAVVPTSQRVYLYLDRAPAQPLSLRVTSSSPSTFSVPSRVTVPAGATDIQFTAVLNTNPHTTGDTDLKITVSEPSFHSIETDLRIRDIIKDTLSLELFGSTYEGELTRTNLLRVRMSSPLDHETLVSLTSLNPELLEIPDHVLIPAGITNVVIPLRALDDGVTNGTRYLKITAAAPGFDPSETTIIVVDNHIGSLFVTANLQGALEERSIGVRFEVGTIDQLYYPFDGTGTLSLITANGIRVEGTALQIPFKKGFAFTNFPMPRMTLLSARLQGSIDGQITVQSAPFDWLDGWVSTNSFSGYARDPKREELLSVAWIPTNSPGSFILSMNPVTGAELWRIPLESAYTATPAMALSSDSHFLYVSLSGTGGIARVNLETRTIDQTLQLDSTNNAAKYALAIAVSPEDPNLLMVMRGDVQRNPLDTALLRGGVRAPLTVSYFEPGSSSLDIGNTFCFFVNQPAVPYSVHDSRLRRLEVSVRGLTLSSNASSGLEFPVDYFQGLPVVNDDSVYFSSGARFDAGSGGFSRARWQPFPDTNGRDLRSLCIDAVRGRMFYLTYPNDHRVLRVLDPETYLPLSSVVLPGAFTDRPQVDHLQYWGGEWVSFLSSGRIHMTRHPLPLNTADGPLVLSQKVDATTNAVQSPFTYHISVTHQGSLMNSNAFVIERLPLGVDLKSLSPSVGIVHETNGLVKWDLGPLEPGTVAKLDVTISTPSTGKCVSKVSLYNASATSSVPVLFQTNWVEVVPGIPSLASYPAFSSAVYDALGDRVFVQLEAGAMPVYLDWRTGQFRSLATPPKAVIKSFSIAPRGQLMYLVTEANSVLRYDLTSETFRTPIVPGGVIQLLSVWSGHPDTFAVITVVGQSTRTAVFVNGSMRGVPGGTDAVITGPLYWSEDGKFLYRMINYGGPESTLARQSVTPARVTEVEFVGQIPQPDRNTSWSFLGDRFFSERGLTFAATNIADVTSVGSLFGATPDPVRGVMDIVAYEGNVRRLLEWDPKTLRVLRQGAIPNGLWYRSFFMPAGPNRFLFRGEAGDKVWAANNLILSMDAETNAVVSVRASAANGDELPLSSIQGQVVGVNIKLRNEGVGIVYMQNVRGSLPVGLHPLYFPGVSEKDFEIQVFPTALFPGETVSAQVDIRCDQAGDYKFPVKAAWTNILGQVFEAVVDVTIQVKRAPAADVRIVATAPILTGSPGDKLRCLFLITNAGPDVAQDLTVTPVPTVLGVVSNSEWKVLGDTPSKMILAYPSYIALPTLEPGTGFLVEVTSTLASQGAFRLFSFQAHSVSPLDPDHGNDAATTYIVSKLNFDKGQQVQHSVFARDMVLDPVRNILYLVPSSGEAPIADQVWRLDLDSGEMHSWLPAAAPALLAIDADKDTLYAMSKSARSVTRLSIQSQSVGSTLHFLDSEARPLSPIACAASPVDKGVIAFVLQGPAGQCELRLYEGDEPRGNVAQFLWGGPDSVDLKFSPSGAELFLWINGNVTKYWVDKSGVVPVPEFQASVYGPFAFYGKPESLLTFDGRVISAETGQVQSQLPGLGIPLIDDLGGFLYFLRAFENVGGGVVTSFNSVTLDKLWEWNCAHDLNGALKTLVLHDGRLAVLRRVLYPFRPELGNELLILDPASVHSQKSADLVLLDARPLPSNPFSGVPPTAFVEVGQRYTNTWVVSNAGPWLATGVRFTSNLPEGFVSPSNSVPVGSVPFSGTEFSADIPPLPPFGTAQVSVVVEAISPHVSRFDAYVHGEQPDPNPNSNTLSLPIAVPRPITISSQPVVVLEPVGLEIQGSVVVTLSRVPSLPVSFRVSNQDGTAKAGSDYVAFSKLVTFPARSTSLSQIVPIRILQDRIQEPDEVFYVRISEVTNAVAAETLIPWTIQEPLPTLSVSDETIRESDGLSGQARFQIGMSATSSVPVRVGIRTLAGTAIPDSDFRSRDSVVVIPPGQTNVTVQVQAMDDLIEEGDENFYLSITSAVGAIPPKFDSLGVIMDDDGRFGPVITGLTFSANFWRLTVVTVAGSEYSFESTPSLFPPVWKPIGATFKATSTQTVRAFSTPTPGERFRYFRVVRTK